MRIAEKNMAAPSGSAFPWEREMDRRVLAIDNEETMLKIVRRSFEPEDYGQVTLCARLTFCLTSTSVLTIYGRVDFEAPKDHRPVLSEYGIGDYQRVFTLSEEVDRDKIQASVKNGVLKLVMPKTESVKTRKIPIKAEGIGGMMNPKLSHA